MRNILFELEDHSSRPVFLRLADAIIGSITAGRLKPGDRLPGTRALAAAMKLHRNTVDAAYREALAQGWLAAEPSRGTFVARDLPTSPRKRSAVKAPLTARRSALSSSKEQKVPPALHVSDGAPDPRLIPNINLARAFRHALNAPDFLSSVGYDDPRGLLVLREAIRDHLAAERGLSLDADDVMITRGSQMALFLAANAVLQPGETIAVEEPGYPLAFAAFRAAGARIVGIPVDAGGIDVEVFEKLAEQVPELRAVYVTPHHQYPTTVTLGAARRLRLIELARQHRLTIIEDDYDHEYRFDGKPVLPLAARAAGNVSIVYVGSLSKILAPSLRLGYAVAPAGLLRRMADRREAIDRQGDVPLEAAVADLIRDGEVGRHARKTRRIYQARRNHMVEELRQHLGSVLTFDVPAGGLALWVRIADGTNAESWAKAAARLGLMINPGLAYCIETARARQAFRLGFAGLNETEITRAVTLLKCAHASL